MSNQSVSEKVAENWPNFSPSRMKQEAQKPKPPASKTTASYWQQKVFREKKFDSSDESASDCLSAIDERLSSPTAMIVRRIISDRVTTKAKPREHL